MKSTFVIFVIFLHTWLNAQTKLNWSESFVSDTHMNQIAIAMDSTGNTWAMMVPEGGMSFDELNLKIDAPAHSKNVIVRINPQGKTDRVVSIEGKNSGAGIGAIACNANNEVWIVAPYAGLDPEVATKQKKVMVKGDSIPGGLLLSAISSNGDIRFAVDLPIRFSNESFFITFDHDGNAHLLTSRIDIRYERSHGLENTPRSHYTLTHTKLNDKGEITESKEYYLGEMRSANCRMSKIHFTPLGDYYITTRMTTSIEENGKVIVKNTNPTPRNDFERWEDHAVLIHFNRRGKYDWHRLFFGDGHQLISAITSDSTNVYLTATFNYECSSNEDNQITYEDNENEIVEGMERVCMDHQGKMKWVDRISGRRYYTAGLMCWGIETDHKGQLVYFCTFRDTITIHSEERDFVLDWVSYTNDQSFVMIADTAGHIVDVRRDLRAQKGRGFGLSSSSWNNTFSCGGIYFSQFVGTVYDSTLGAWTKGEMRTDLHIEVNGQRGSSFKNHQLSGGVFAYSFDLPSIPVIEDSNEDPQYVNQPTPVELEALLEEQQQKPIDEPNEEETNIVETRPSLGLDEAIAMELFPNPTRSAVSIRLSQLEGPSELYIHDAVGTLILTKSFYAIDPELTLNYNASEWNAGRYLVTCVSAGQKVTKVLVVTG